jgi:hypothetical protein
MRSKKCYSSIAYLLLNSPKLSLAQVEVSNKQQMCKYVSIKAIIVEVAHHLLLILIY